jgi:hypothetical protein
MKKILMLCIMVLFVSGNAYAAFSNGTDDHSKTVSTQVSINSVCHLDPQSGLSNQQDHTFNLAGRGDNAGTTHSGWLASATEDADLNLTTSDDLDGDITAYHYLMDATGNFNSLTFDYTAGTDYSPFELWSKYKTGGNTPAFGTYTTAVTITCADDDD